MHVDGIDLARISPAAWVVTLVMGILTNYLAASGYHIGHVRMQSLILLTLFFGAISLIGTGQIIDRLRGEGRTGLVSMLAGAVLAGSGGVMAYGLNVYFSIRD